MTKQPKEQTKLESLAEKSTIWIGSTASLVVHTIVFIASFVLVLLGYDLDRILLILTTAVSLEAIYLALFIQMSVNKAAVSLAEVEEDIDEIQEDVEGIEKDIDEIQEDVDEIEKDADEDDLHDEATMKALTQMQTDIMKVMEDLKALKDQKKE